VLVLIRPPLVLEDVGVHLAGWLKSSCASPPLAITSIASDTDVAEVLQASTTSRATAIQLAAQQIGDPQVGLV